MKKKLLHELFWLAGIYIAAWILCELAPQLSRFNDHLVDSFTQNDLGLIPSFTWMVSNIFGTLVFLVYLVRCIISKFRVVATCIILLIITGLQLFILNGLLSVYFSVLALLDILPTMTVVNTSEGSCHIAAVAVKILLAIIFGVTALMIWKNRRMAI